MKSNPLSKYQYKINQLAQKHHISYLALFGSHARGEASKDSDIDLVVRYSKPVGLLHHADSQLKFEQLFGKSVDLISEGAISPLLKPYIAKDLTVIYDQRSG